MHPIIAAVDLGSNSFRLQVARVVEGQIYPLDNMKGGVRLGAGLQADMQLDRASQLRALECLKQFGQRLRGLPKEAVRAVGTNTLRVAKGIDGFLEEAEAALGYPIEIIAGKEEARLIYLGAMNSLPPSEQRRFVVDIGGGSTEFIVGTQHKTTRLDSLPLGCVAYSLHFFPDGQMDAARFAAAELSARNALQRIAAQFPRAGWDIAIGTSGTARSLKDILLANGQFDTGITWAGLNWLRDEAIKAKNLSWLQLAGLRADRHNILPGGLAIMRAVFHELKIDTMQVTLGALRDGVLYDLMGRLQHKDPRENTVSQFKRRYHVDVSHANRIAQLSQHLLKPLLTDLALPDNEQETALQQVDWAAKLHEIGLSISNSCYHRHSAYILQHADMPGFSKREQMFLANLVLGHRGRVEKMVGIFKTPLHWHQLCALRMAHLFFYAQSASGLPPISLQAVPRGYQLTVDAGWLDQLPLMRPAIAEELQYWKQVGFIFEWQDA